jgi:hypothetical protein
MTSNSTASRCQPHRLTRFLILIDARHATHSSVNQQTLASVNQHRHHQPHRDILILFVARLSSRLSRHRRRRSKHCKALARQASKDLDIVSI